MVTPARDWWDAISDAYDDAYHAAADRVEDDYVAGLVSGLIPLVGPVLDVGCGTGLFIDLAKYIEPGDYEGFDLSPGMVKKAEANHPGYTFYVAEADTEMATIPDGKFQTIVCLFGTFSYMISPIGVLQSMYSVLRPGGHVILMALGPSRVKGDASWWQQPGGVILYDPVSLRTLCERAGFQVELCHSMTRRRFGSRWANLLQLRVLKAKPNWIGNHTIAVLRKDGHHA